LDSSWLAILPTLYVLKAHVKNTCVGTALNFRPFPWIHDCSPYLLLRNLRDEVLKKVKIFQKTAGYRLRAN
jgi:hypothetical protein